jgi:hypothetical protein
VVRIDASTYEQRQAGHLLTRPLAVESLLLPFATPSAPKPRFVPAGRVVAPEPSRLRVFDRTLPRLPVHDEYLEQRQALGAGTLALVDWCLRNKLDACAEFEAAVGMHEIGNFQAPTYAPFLQRWLPLRDRRQLDVSVPLPLEGEWYVLPDSSGHHPKKAFAAYAFDMVQRRGGRINQGTGKQLEDYYAFNQPIVAQADGVVVSVEDHFPDNTPGTVAAFDTGNDIVVDYGGGILGFYAHLRKGSAVVKAGDRVVAGSKLAAVGNSGASSVPHLHLTMLDWGYDSIRGRFHGEVMRDGKWTTFAGRNLETGNTYRNQPAAPATTGH